MKKKKCAILIWLPTHAFRSRLLPKAKNKDLDKTRRNLNMTYSETQRKVLQSTTEAAIHIFCSAP